jgi:outer membrane protein TolC
LRAREAEARRARAEYLPTLGLTGSGGGAFRHYHVEVPRTGESHTFDDQEPVYGARLELEWTLFDGFLRESAVRRADAEAGAARADLESVELRALQEVWSAYADARTALRKLDFAEALLAASQEAYDAELRSYRSGLATLLDLLAAQRDLARARSTRIASRSEVLASAAALAWAAGGPPGSPP